MCTLVKIQHNYYFIAATSLGFNVTFQTNAGRHFPAQSTYRKPMAMILPLIAHRRNVVSKWSVLEDKG